MKSCLNDWVSIWHRPYRGLMTSLLLTGVVTGGLVFLENSFLKGLVQSLSATAERDQSFFASLFRDAAGQSLVAWLFLGSVFAVGLGRSFLGAGRDILSARLEARARIDLEQQILMHLLHQGDAFFSSHSTGEILNRLEVDLFRVLDRRQTLVNAWWSIVIVLGNLVFFAIADWHLALVVVLISIAGILVTQYASKPLKGSDAEYFRAGDQVKMDFEDYLKAVSEIQVGGLYTAMAKRFRKPQDMRVKAYFRWVRGNTKVRFVKAFWPVLAFLAGVLVVVYSYAGTSGNGSEKLALIPVLIFALPTIFNSVTNLAGMHVSFQVAKNSVERIREYNFTQRKDKAPARDRGQKDSNESARSVEPEASIKLENIVFRYRRADGRAQGGVTDINATFQPDNWTALVGGAGSGKSTLCNIVLGRLAPDSGRVSVGGKDLTEIKGKDRFKLAALMPQRVVLFDTSIAENLLIGRSGIWDSIENGNSEGVLETVYADSFSDSDMQILDDIGLAEVCRIKALDMTPIKTGRSLTRDQICELRNEGQKIIQNLNIEYTRFSDDEPDPQRPLLEAFMGGRLDLQRAIKSLYSEDRSRKRWLQKAADSPLGDFFAEVGKTVVESSRNLLEMESYEAFVSLSPVSLDRPVWEDRRNFLRSVGRNRTTLPAHPSAERLKHRLFRIGLTTAPSEIREGAATGKLDMRSCKELRKKFQRDATLLKERLIEYWSPLDENKISYDLNWRDNLLFARLHLTNNRQARRVDDSLLELTERTKWKDFFVEQGLNYNVGRNGWCLSGGQGQLVSMGRTLLRRTPVLVLDEPTSALDPAKRNRVVSFLNNWKKNRIVITISHDPELARSADRVILMKDGRVAAEGRFDDLQENSEDFQRIFRKRT